MATQKTVYFMGGLQTHGRGVKSEMVAQWCDAQGVDFQIIDWQYPADGHIDQWESVVRHDFGKTPHAADNGHESRDMLIASSLAVWPAMLALSHIGNEVRRFIGRFVAIAPVIDATQAFRAAFADPNRDKLEIPCGNDVAPFVITRQHIARADPYLLTDPNRGGAHHKWVERLPETVHLTIMSGNQDMQAARAVENMWRGKKRSEGIIEMQGQHYENNPADATLIQLVLGTWHRSRAQ